ncbi:MAG: MATE family efflux transporter [Lachnospiraceae bacterium]|nr:MATE family efflux transporter [Lachnospiraceae bacterium]
MKIQDDFYKRVLVLVLPMALQNLINVGVSATDVIMLGRVGEEALSGCSLGGQVFWILSLFLFGSTSGASVLIAQYWGKKDIASIERVMGIVVMLTVTVGIGFMMAALLIPGKLMSLFTKDEQMIEQAVLYLRIVAFTYPLSAFTMAYLNMLKSIERVTISTIVYGSSLFINIIVNAVLIFGLFGFPSMGIQGAAAGTLVARVTELLILLFYVKRFRPEVRVKWKHIVHRDQVMWKDFLYYASPVILNEVLWGAGYSANTAIIGHLGSGVVAANSVAQVTRQLSMVVGFGIASATAIMIGKAIGEGRKDVAKEYGRRFTVLGLVCGIGGALIIVILRPVILWGIGLDGDAERYLGLFLYMMAAYAIGQSVNTTWVVGVFRSGGDTRFGMILDMTTMWCGSILFSALAAFVFHFPVPVVYGILLSDEFVKVPFCFWRYRKMVWLKDVTRENTA